MEEYKIDKTLDCIGLYCPEPLFQTREMLDNINTGEILEVMTDDPASEEDLQRLVKRTGHQLLSLQNEAGKLRFLIKKN